MELWLEITSINNHPYLTWNPYHNEQDVNYYKIYKKKNSANFELLNTTTNTYYEDVSETIYSIPNEKTYAYYKITAQLTGGGESLESNTERKAVNDYIQQDKINLGTEKSSSEFLFSLTNFPNPFNPTTAIIYQLASDSYVTLKVYDVLGKEMSELVKGQQPAGSYEVMFNANNLSSGIYYYQLQTENFITTKKMILAR